MLSFIESFGGFECPITDPVKKMGKVIGAVKELNIVDVLSHYGVDFSKRGSRYLSLCPFHMDNHIGSFVVDAEENSCFCFACATGGDTINAVAKMFNMEWQEAVLQIAADEDIIDEETYEELSEIEYVCKKTTNTTRRMIRPTVVRPAVSTIKMWTDIYEFMQKEWKLIPMHEEQLKEERQLSDERIKKDYFTMRSKDRVAISALVAKIKKQFPEYADKLHTVPGFFEELMSNNQWNISMLAFSGIGILIRNADGMVVGVQVRMDKKDENGLRYKYFSYIFTPNKFSRGGGSCGTPIDVCWPDNVTEKTSVAITEGRFKAEVLAKQGFIALSIQGVNNFTGVELDLADIERIIGRKIHRVRVFYDADLVRNEQVYKAGIALASYLEDMRPDILVSFVVWAEIYGKGIDDMIFAGFRNEAKSILFQKFYDTYDKAYEGAVNESGLEVSVISKLSKEDRTRFLNIFERIVTEELL